MDKSKNIELEYLNNLIATEKLYAACGAYLYCSFMNNRVELHQELCDKYNLDYMVCKKITDNLDVEIGLDTGEDYTSDEMNVFADKFAKRLREASNGH
jgi:hypothetical protein